jgi:hypothetical protein
MGTEIVNISLKVTICTQKNLKLKTSVPKQFDFML